MRLSEKTDELFKAFSKFQGELDNASKAKQGHGYSYADLAECINTAKPFLEKNGLAVTQMMGMAPDFKQTMITMLTHESGQYISSEFVMVDAKLQGGGGKNPVQELGSAITYHRRYAYAAIIGLAQEDNDAAGLTRKNENKARASFNPVDCLGEAKHSINSAKTETDLTSIWNNFGARLKAHGEQFEELKAMLQVRKQELTENN